MKMKNSWLILSAITISCYSILFAADNDWEYKTSQGKTIDLRGLVANGTTLVEKEIHERQGCVFITMSLHKDLSNGRQTDFNIEYIQRPEDKTPILFFRDSRSIEALLDHNRQLILINLHSCSNCNSVWIYDFKTGMTRQIDREAVDFYDEKDPDWERHGFPFGDNFSKDDKSILIHMTKKAFFEVNVLTGKILREHD